MARTIPIVGIAAALLVALAGCAPAADDTTGGASATPTPSPTSTEEASAEPSPSASEEPEGIDTSDWLEYSTHDGDMTYRYPASWTLESESSFFAPDADRDDVQDPYERWIDSSSLTAPNGQTLLQSTDYVDIGGACGEDYQFPIEVLASEPADVQAVVSDHVPQITTVALGTDDGRWTFGVGITSLYGSLEPGATGCSWYFAHSSSLGGLSLGTRFMIGSLEDDELWTVDTLDDAHAYMETEEYSTILEILRSVRIS